MIDSYISIDLETTGLSPRRDRIIEIGAVKVQDGRRVAEYRCLVNPGCKLSEETRCLTGITDSELAGAPAIGGLLPDLLVFLADLPLVGHRILFDYSFLKKAANDLKLPFEKSGIDTLKLARKYAEPVSKTLGSLCSHYGIPLTAHRAWSDAAGTAELYRILAQQYEPDNPGDKLFYPEKLSCCIKRDTPATKPQKERLYRLLTVHGITVDYDIEQLTRSEASRYTDKILSAYGRLF